MEGDNLNWLIGQLPTEDELQTRISELDSQIRVLAGQQAALQAALQARRIAAQALGLSQSDLEPDSMLVVDTNALLQENGNGVASGKHRPALTRSILTLLADAPDQTMTATEIMAALAERDLLPNAKDPRKAVGATLSRMVNRTGDLQHTGFALYRLASKDQESPAAVG